MVEVRGFIIHQNYSTVSTTSTQGATYSAVISTVIYLLRLIHFAQNKDLLSSKTEIP